MTDDTAAARIAARLNRIPDSDSLLVEKTDLREVLAENQAMRDAIEALKPWLIPLMEKYLRETIIPLWQALKPLVETQDDVKADLRAARDMLRKTDDDRTSR